MAISYKKLWKLLIDKDMTAVDLRLATGIAPNTMTKLRRDEEVSMTVLAKICAALNANIGDITENPNSIHNVAGNVHNRSPIFSLKAGDVIRAVVTLSNLHTCTTAFSVFLAKANGTTSKDIFSGKASAEKPITLTEDFDVGAIGMWVKTAVCVLDYDLELYVNEVRYI